MTLTEVVEGWTGRLTFTLLSDGLPFDGTGMALSNLYLTNGRREIIDTSGDFGWVSPPDGTVYYDPDVTDFVEGGGPYTLRFEVTAAGKVVYFPNGPADEIIVNAKRR